MEIYNKQYIYGIPINQKKTLSYILNNNNNNNELDYLIFDQTLDEESLKYANTYECVYFINKETSDILLDYLKTCKNNHVTFWLSKYNPKSIILSDNIKSVTLIGVEHNLPKLDGNNLETLFLCNEYTKKTQFNKWSMIPSNIKTLGFINLVGDQRNLDQIPSNVNTIVIMDYDIHLINVVSTIEKIIFIPLIQHKSNNCTEYVNTVTMSDYISDILTISNPENLKTTVKIEYIKCLCRLKFECGSSLIIRFPRKKDAVEYINNRIGSKNKDKLDLLIDIFGFGSIDEYVYDAEISDFESVIDSKLILS